MPVKGRNNWPVRRLGDVAELFDHKRVPLNSRERAQRQGQYPYYGAQGIIDRVDGYLFDGRYTLVAEDGENLNSRKLPLALFAEGQFWVNNHAHVLRAKPDVADDVFLLAWLNHADIKPYVTGAAQPKLSQANLRIIEIPLPPLPIQRRIAGVISAYDDLIENNMRRIQILERMAQALYREWFVNFRFPDFANSSSRAQRAKAGASSGRPGHAQVKRVASPLGPIPQGWEAKRLGDVLFHNKVATTAGKHLEGRLYVPIDCLPQRSLALRDAKPVEEAQSSLQLFEADDILFGAMRPYFHKVVIAPFPGVTRATCFVLKPHQPQWFSFALLTLFQEETIKFATAHSKGATIPYVAWDGSLADMPIVVPAVETCAQFDEIVKPMLRWIQQSFSKTSTLRRTRDLLLPKLISGALDLSGLGIQTED